ncbi:MAG: glycoside hydrolase family 88 protein [Opitutae bacterium]|nr:glycoside hydrolase family 88 protein [Opitutae bacterium]
MGFYFENHDSMYAQTGQDIDRTLACIVHRFVGQNPPHPFTYRAYCKRGILRDREYRYRVDFNSIFPTAQNEQLVYAWSKYWSEKPGELKFDVTCFGPITIYCNGATVFESDIFTERYSDTRHTIFIPVQAGWNHLVVRCKKTRAGFGGAFGTWLGKLSYYFLMPTPERDGQEGWIFTAPMAEPLAQLPGPGTGEHKAGQFCFPANHWDARQAKQGQLQRLYGMTPGAQAVGWTKALLSRPGRATYTLAGRHQGPVSVWIGGREVFRAAKSGTISARVQLPFGDQDVQVLSTCAGKDWGFELALRDGRTPVRLVNPANVTGTDQPWIFLGAFAADAAVQLDALKDLHQVHAAIVGDTYWRIDAPDTWVRPYNENPCYGRWNYPLGVTLYGLLHAAKAIGSAEVQQYIVDHIQSCCDTLKYALWDKAQYGGATSVHTLLSSIDSLDDCGSFGSVLLEVAQHHDIAGMREVADYVADYIANRQVRLSDGTFFRKNLMHVFHEETMWADDLYMSVPFLCRYYQLTGETKYIDDAARQFLGFKARLYLPEHRVMSHVYDFTRQMATGVPWGRGNGWVIFSLSELLAVLPINHALLPELLRFFRELCAGYLALQDADGMWHQVLTHPDSYPETSCTSMFTYAFARGIQYGWLDQPEPYLRAVFRAWEALNRSSIDRGGNVHGVCRGSEFSFTPEYYKQKLLWNLNDTHGIGIVLLAGVEVRRLREFLRK